MKQKIHYLFMLLLMLLTGVGGVKAQATYKLEKVTKVEAGGLYVFEQSGYVMTTVSNKVLQITKTYKTTDLKGSENYVFTLESATANDKKTQGFKMKNMSLSSNQYIGNTSSKTDMTATTSSSAAVWAFNFQEDQTVLIQNLNNSNRFLGLNQALNNNPTGYKAYAISNNMGNTPHDIVVYKLVEETGDEPVVVAIPTFSPEAGEVSQGTEVTISTATEGATIYYTIDGSTPTENSTKGSSVVINEPTTLKAIAVKDGMTNSAVATAEYVIKADYATLPFNWAGGTSATLAALDGVTASGLGSDYAKDHAPYYVKFDGNGDYIQVKTDGQPGKVSIGVKMIGGANTSSITVQGSSDGERFKDIETLSISGNQNDELTLTTTKGFEETDRYVRLVFTKGSNVGVGPISIAKPLSKHTATFYINGESSTAEVAEGSAITFPAVPDDINGKSFVGWITNTIDGTTNTAPAFVTSASMGNSDVTYYAVFAIADATGESVETKTQTLQYDTWTYSGTTTDKNSYRLFGNESYIESEAFDLSKLSKVIVYGGTYGGGGYNSLTIGDGTNIWKSVTVSGSSQTGTNTYTDGTSLTGTNKLRITATAGDGKSNGLRISKVEIFTNEPSIVYSDYCTTVVAPVKPAKPIVFHDGGEYEGTLTVAMAGEGTIMYKLGADGEATAYTAPITINATTTVTAWAEKDGVKSDEVSKTFTIVPKQAGAEVADGYYNIKTSDGKYVNVAGRKTVTLASDAKSAGTVIRVSADANGVKVLRSQGVDVPGYAKKAMNYVPEIVQLAVDKLHAEGSGAILGEHGLDAIMEEFNKSFDYNLYLEKSGDAYRIYGRTPSMKPVVDFYAKNKANVDAKLPQLEAFINSAIDKVLEKTGNRGASILVDFKLHDVWQNMDGTLTEPVDEASTMKFYEEVLSSETNVWNFAYQTAMIYWGNLKYNDTFKKYIGKLGDYAKYIDKVENIRPNFKYYIVPSASGVDFISQGNEAIINNNASAAWTMQECKEFQVELPTEKNVTVYPTSGGKQTTYKEYYTTLYTDFAYTLREGVKAYKVTAIDEKTGVAKREEITGTIPAQTPVLLVGESNTATLTLSTEAGTAITGNLLVGPDALINEYQIQTPQVVSLFEFAKEILGESAYKAYVEKYEHLMLKNAGTVNNKYFFGLTEDDLGDVTNLRILGMGYENELGFHDIWEKIDANKAFILTNDYDPVKLFLVGDVNRDGAVSIADVTALVNIILGKAKYPDDNDKYDFEAANVNGDEIISIADVTALVNIILGK